MRGIRLKDCIRMQQKLMNVRVRYCGWEIPHMPTMQIEGSVQKYGIYPLPFYGKGRAAKDEPLRKVLCSELSKERATWLEGSFALKSNTTHSARIKARNRKTEILLLLSDKNIVQGRIKIKWDFICDVSSIFVDFCRQTRINVTMGKKYTFLADNSPLWSGNKIVG